MERSRSKLDPLQALMVKDRELSTRIDKALNADRSVDWIAAALVGAWLNYGGGNENAAFSRTPSGLVILRGVVRSGAVPSIIFTLPVGFRPTGIRRFSVVANSAFGYVAVVLNGQVTFEAGSNVWVDLSSVIFRAEV